MESTLEDVPAAVAAAQSARCSIGDVHDLVVRALVAINHGNADCAMDNLTAAQVALDRAVESVLSL